MDEVLQVLSDCKESRNAAIQAYKDLQKLSAKSLTAEQLIGLDSQLQEALDEGREQLDMVERTKRMLQNAPSYPAKDLVLGF